MKKVLIPIAHGFEEIETITSADVLRRSGAKVLIAGTNSGPIIGSRGIKLIPAENIKNISADGLDLVVLPGGEPGTDNLLKMKRLIDILIQMNHYGKLIGAICAAPIILELNGILKNRKHTCHPSVKHKLKGRFYSEERVVVDKNIVTSQGPGTLMEFALRLVEILFGSTRMEIINKAILAKL